ncbi:hypothetical protein EK0264_03775 [Epidermidibacterium keratini]|uniref:Fibronectin type-III domain-containing protein n=1 Tax=Epidermidibacterium keratini TaxID=1891644 RepID=A0A7L4YK53_9ACTN|nr:fibronectin type III domain-containing protein [Epidermidibacterium keratini]QHB99489.1 hypothetical protein EK0264_03775 [Epidermidibacterium keratini]
MTKPPPQLAVRLVARTFEGKRIGSIPSPSSVRADLPALDLSTCMVSYAADATRSSLIDRDGAVWCVETASIDGVELGEWVEPAGARFFTMNRGWNRTGGIRLWQIDGVSIGYVLGGEIVGRTIGKEDKDGNRAIGTTNAGALMRALIVNGKARQSANGLRWFAPLVINFDGNRDSAGQPWTTSMPITLPPQRSIAEVLAQLVRNGLCEYEWQGLELRIYREGTMLRDRSTGRNPVVLRDATSTDAPEKSTLVDMATDVDVVGDDGKSWTFAGTDPVAPLGRIVRTVSQGSVSVDATAQLYADRLLIPGAKPRTQYTRASSNAAGGRLPVLDVANGDRVLIQTDEGREAVDVVGTSFGLEADEVTWHWTLGTRLDGILTKIQRRADLALEGAGVAGGDGMPPRPPGPDTSTPAKVGAVVRSTRTYLDVSGRVRGAVQLSWPAVVEDVAGNVMERVGSYEIFGRTSGEASARLVGTVPGDVTTITLDDLEPAARWEYTVRAVSPAGIAGAPSDLIVIDVEDDTEAPYSPTAPVLSTSAGTIMVRWDGKGVGPNTGDPIDMPPDLRAIIVRDYGTNPDNPTPARLGAIAGVTDGDFVLALQRTSGERYYFDLIAVDHTGNESAPSAKSSIVARSVADDPEIVNALGAALVADSAWIGELTAVVVTVDMLKGKRVEGGTVATGPVNTARVELAPGGIYQRDAQNRAVGSWEPNSGIRIFNPANGQLQTQLNGEGYALSVRNPLSGNMTPVSSIIFGGAMATNDALFVPTQPPSTVSIWGSPPNESITWDHAGGRAVVWWMCYATATLRESGVAIQRIDMAFRLYRVSDGALYWDSSQEASGGGMLTMFGQPEPLNSDDATFSGSMMYPFTLPPDRYRWVPIFRCTSGMGPSGALARAYIRRRSAAIGQW